MNDVDQMARALSGLEPEALRRIADHLPAHARLFESLADALEEGKADASAVDGVWAEAGDPAALLRRVRPALADAAASVEGLRRGLSEARARLAEGEQLRIRAREMLRPFLAAAADEPRLHHLLQEAGVRLADEAPWQAAERAQAAASGLVEVLLDGLSQPTPDFDPRDLARRHAELEAVDAELRSAPAGLAEVLILLRRARDVAHALGHGLRAPLALVVARLGAVLDPATSADAWRLTLDRALDADDLEVTLEAGRQVQADAFARGAPRIAGLVSHRIAELARRTGAVEVEIIARLEQALAAAREPSYAQRARDLAADALAGAEAIGGPVLARARLMDGQLLDHLGDGDGARRVLRRLMQQAKVPGAVTPDILGRAAFTLGKSEAAVGQRARARQNLQLAFDLAIEHHDLRLYDAALPALLDVLEAVDPPAAADVFRAAESHLATWGPGTGAELRAAELRTALAGRFGAATVARWMGEPPV